MKETIIDLKYQIIDFGVELGMNLIFSESIAYIILMIIIVLSSFLVDKLVKGILLQSLESLVEKSKSNWDDYLIEHKVIAAIAHIVPVFIVFHFLPIVFVDFPKLILFFDRLEHVLIILVCMIVIFRLLNTLKSILDEFKSFADKPIESFIQLAKIIIGILLGVFILSILVNKSIAYFFGAFGAMSAVLILVFKDSILGFIASIQLSANDMIKKGDWVQMDKYGADGNVEEINLTTVKIKNWDKTLTTVPTYAFISDSFKNWRGMEETGARRIARSILINQNSVKFATPEMIESFKKIHILKGYIEEKEKELKEYNEQQNIDTSHVSNGRRLTNIGTFRAYLTRYLKNHPKIDKSQTLIVRQMQPTENGLPIQIYAFSSDIAWVNYEAIQSDIFDHTMAVAPQFGLEIFQHPSGADFRKAFN